MRLCFAWTRKPPFKRLDRLDPVLPLSPGRLERHGFEYRRNGTLSLYAALDVKTGKVQGKTAERHTSAAFIDFLEQLVSTCKTRQEIHIILDNLSAHKPGWRGTTSLGPRNLFQSIGFATLIEGFDSARETPGVPWKQ